MKKIIFGLAAGLLIGSAGTAIASQTGAVEAVFAKFNLKVDDREIVQIEPLIYDGTSYLPVREVGELLGYQVDYEDVNRLIILETPGQDKKSSSEAGKKVNIADINMDEWASYSDLSYFYVMGGSDRFGMNVGSDGNIVLNLNGREIPFAVSSKQISNDHGPTIYKDVTGKYSILVINKKEYFPWDIGKDFGLPSPKEWIPSQDVWEKYPSFDISENWTDVLREHGDLEPIEIDSPLGGTIRAMNFGKYQSLFNISDIEKLLADQ